MSPSGQGALAIVASSTIWGLSGLYFAALRDLPAAEVLVHRTLWSVVFLLGLFAVRGRLGEYARVMTSRATLGALLLPAAMISVNWLVYIWAVQTGRATQASLGYYVFPLFAALLSVIVLKERLRPLQSAAIALAALAVVILAAGTGRVPWVALSLAASFAVYGLAKKRLEIGPVMSVAAEVSLVTPFLLLWMAAHGDGIGRFGASAGDALMLMGLVTVTGIPLVLFSFGARRLSYAATGLIQYINPTLQFVVAVTILGETATASHMIALPLIWAGLALYSADAIAQERKARRAAISASTSPII